VQQHDLSACSIDHAGGPTRVHETWRGANETPRWNAAADHHRDQRALVDTLTATEPDAVSIVATMLAVPTAIACTSPPALTVAIAGFELDQVIGLPVSTSPLASIGSAASCCVAPMESVTVAGITITFDTGVTPAVTVSSS
jgi:hypothetical protein